MAKVYIFRDNDMFNLEKRINDFIADKDLVDIKINSYPISALTGTTIWSTAVIIYKDRNPLEHPERYLEDAEAIVDDMTMAQRKALRAYLNGSIYDNGG